MIIMALDHVRDFLHASAWTADPLDHAPLRTRFRIPCRRQHLFSKPAENKTGTEHIPHQTGTVAGGTT